MPWSAQSSAADLDLIDNLFGPKSAPSGCEPVGSRTIVPSKERMQVFAVSSRLQAELSPAS